MRRRMKTGLALGLLLAAGSMPGCDLYDQSLPPKIDAGPDSGPDAQTDGDVDADPRADAGDAGEADAAE